MSMKDKNPPVYKGAMNSPKGDPTVNGPAKRGKSPTSMDMKKMGRNVARARNQGK